MERAHLSNILSFNISLVRQICFDFFFFFYILMKPKCVWMLLMCVNVVNVCSNLRSRKIGRNKYTGKKQIHKKKQRKKEREEERKKEKRKKKENFLFPFFSFVIVSNDVCKGMTHLPSHWSNWADELFKPFCTSKQYSHSLFYSLSNKLDCVLKWSSLLLRFTSQFIQHFHWFRNNIELLI